MTDLSEKTLKAIEEKNIVAKPKWRFLLKNYVFWLFFVLATFIGALAVTVIIFIFLDHDWDVFEYFDKSLFEYIFISLPYFWLIIFLLFLAAAYYNFKYTRRGYRYNFFKIFAGGLLLSLTLGILLFLFGLDSEIHEIFLEQIPFYNKLVYTKEDIWVFPDKGLLSGEIIDNKNKEEFKLRDFSGNIWQIQTDGTTWPDNFVFQVGARIKLIGELKDDNIFLVKIIKPWDWDR